MRLICCGDDRDRRSISYIGTAPKRFDIFSPQTGGCSEGLGAFRFFFKQQYLYDSVTLEGHPVRDDRLAGQGHLGLDGENWS